MAVVMKDNAAHDPVKPAILIYCTKKADRQAQQDYHDEGMHRPAVKVAGIQRSSSPATVRVGFT